MDREPDEHSPVPTRSVGATRRAHGVRPRGRHLAVSYGNRCHARMKLGQLQKAPEDCETSLKYGQIPESVADRQELVEQLNTRPKS